MTELAQALIQKCTAECAPLLDFSNCRLIEIPDEAFGEARLLSVKNR